MAEENNIGASRLLGTNGLQQAVDSLTTQVGKMTNDVGKLVNSIMTMAGAFNRSSAGGGSYGGNGWNGGSNRNLYGANGGGARFTGFGGFGGRGNGGGGGFGALGAGSRLSAGIGAALSVASAVTDYGNRNMATMFQQNFAGNQSAIYGGNYSTANVHFGMRQQMAQIYSALSPADATKAFYINQQTFGNSQFNGQANPAFTYGAQMVGGLAYANPTFGQAAAAQVAAQTYTPRASMAAIGMGLGPTIGPGGRPVSVGTLAQRMYARTFGNQRISMQGLNASLLPGQSLSTNMQFFGSQMGLSQTAIAEYTTLIKGQVAAQNAGMGANQYYNLLNQASNGGSSGAAARAQLGKIGIGASAFEAQRNLNSTRAIRQEDVNESMDQAFIKTTNVVNQFSQALTAMMKATGMDKLLGTSAGILSPVSNALGGFSGAFGAMGGIAMASRFFGGGGGLLGGLGGMFGGGGGAGGAAAAGGNVLRATMGADGVYSVTGLGGGVGGLGMLARMGPYGLAAATMGGASWLGWKGAVPQEAANSPRWQQAIGSTLRYQPFSPFGAAYLQTGMARRAWDAWVTGKNKESFWSLLNPWGTEKRTQSGGGSSSVVGNTPGNGASNMGASAAQIIKYAETQLGVPYLWGGESPGKGMDCSGLTQWAYAQAGVKIPRVAADQQRAGHAVPVNGTQAGDLLFVGNPAHHVVMSIGGGQIIEAPHTGAKVRIRSLNPSEFTSATRIVNNVGNMASLLNNNTAGSNTLNNLPGAGGDIGGGLGGTSELAAIMSALNSVGGFHGSQSSGASTTNGTSGSSGGTGQPAGKGNGSNNPSDLKSYAKALLNQYGWGNQWDAFNSLVMSESGWDVHATNPSSGAYGIAQALPASKYSSAGSDWQSNGDTQLQWMMSYIKGRYGDPSKAWSFHQKNNWYDVGAWSIDKDQNAVVHAGEMIIPAKQAETIRQVLLNNSFNPNNKGGMGSLIHLGGVTVNLPGTFTGSYQDAQDIGMAISKATAEQLRLLELQKGQ